jgi:hypothetical protein
MTDSNHCHSSPSHPDTPEEEAAVVTAVVETAAAGVEVMAAREAWAVVRRAG